MSRIAALVFFVGIVVGLSLWTMGRGPDLPAPANSPAATPSHAAHSHGKRTAKITGPLSVTLQLEAGDPKQIGDPLSFVATVTSDDPVDAVELTWLLPKELEAISGELQTVITRLVPGQSYQARILARSNSAGRHLVHVRASVTAHGATSSVVKQWESEALPRDFVTEEEALELEAKEPGSTNLDATGAAPPPLHQ